MAQLGNVFISWSGARSRAAAVALRLWLPRVIQAVRPWMSEKDIDRGTVWLSELVKALGSMKLGVVCLAPESLSAPWVLFETGVIFKGLDESRVWTYLLGGLRQSDVPQPLGLFQHTVATKRDTFRLLESINGAMGEQGVSAEILKEQFDKYWPELDGKLRAIPEPEKFAVKPRSEREMLAELLELVRAEKGAKPLSELRGTLSELRGNVSSQELAAQAAVVKAMEKQLMELAVKGAFEALGKKNSGGKKPEGESG